MISAKWWMKNSVLTLNPLQMVIKKWSLRKAAPSLVQVTTSRQNFYFNHSLPGPGWRRDCICKFKLRDKTVFFIQWYLCRQLDTALWMEWGAASLLPAGVKSRPPTWPLLKLSPWGFKFIKKQQLRPQAHAQQIEYERRVEKISIEHICMQDFHKERIENEREALFMHTVARERFLNHNESFLWVLGRVGNKFTSRYTVVKTSNVEKQRTSKAFRKKKADYLQLEDNQLEL